MPTRWGPTSLSHWDECWTFSACDEEQVCSECTTGRSKFPQSHTLQPFSTREHREDVLVVRLYELTKFHECRFRNVIYRRMGSRYSECGTIFTESEGCSTTTSQDTTATEITATDSTTSSNFCPSLPQDGGSWICIPEVKL